MAVMLCEQQVVVDQNQCPLFRRWQMVLFVKLAFLLKTPTCCYYASSEIALNFRCFCTVFLSLNGRAGYFTFGAEVNR